MGRPRKEPTWAEIEARLRQWALGVYFDKTFRQEKNHLLRFDKARDASMRPIRNKRLVLWWHERNGRFDDVDLERISV